MSKKDKSGKPPKAAKSAGSNKSSADATDAKVARPKLEKSDVVDPSANLKLALYQQMRVAQTAAAAIAELVPFLQQEQAAFERTPAGQAMTDSAQRPLCRPVLYCLGRCLRGLNSSSRDGFSACLTEVLLAVFENASSHSIACPTGAPQAAGRANGQRRRNEQEGVARERRQQRSTLLSLLLPENHACVSCHRQERREYWLGKVAFALVMARSGRIRQLPGAHVQQLVSELVQLARNNATVKEAAFQALAIVAGAVSLSRCCFARKLLTSCDLSRQVEAELFRQHGLQTVLKEFADVEVAELSADQLNLALKLLRFAPVRNNNNNQFVSRAQLLECRRSAKMCPRRFGTRCRRSALASCATRSKTRCRLCRRRCTRFALHFPS